MSRSVASRRPSVEVKPSHREDDAGPAAVKELHRLEIPLRMAKSKVAMGSAVKEAIGDLPLKEFGHEGLVSQVCSGEKVPDYLARIYENPASRRRLALALLEGDRKVRRRIVLDWDDDRID